MRCMRQQGEVCSYRIREPRELRELRQQDQDRTGPTENKLVVFLVSRQTATYRHWTTFPTAFWILLSRDIAILVHPSTLQIFVMRGCSAVARDLGPLGPYFSPLHLSFLPPALPFISGHSGICRNFMNL